MTQLHNHDNRNNIYHGLTTWAYGNTKIFQQHYNNTFALHTYDYRR